MTTQPPGNDADRTPPHLQGAGTMLATWLTRTPGRELSGVVQEVTDRNGRITGLGPSHTYRIGAVIGQGGQAAVAAATPLGVPDRGPLVARVELNPRDPREWRRRELLLFLAHLSRVTPATYPALIRTTESFVTYAHSSELQGQSRFDSHAGNEPLWVDVMERCTTLTDHLHATHPNGYDLVESAKLAVPLLRTLGVLHDQYRLVHRDIDEGNVLVAPDATLRIADWGVVVPMSGASPYTYTVTFGKPATMPPENRDGDQKVGHHTDAWQAGRLLGVILTGTSPFLNDGTTLNSPRLASLPRELRTVIEGLTNPHVGARLGTYDAATLLEKYIGYPITTPPVPRPRRRKVLVGVATLALVAGAGTIAALNWPNNENTPAPVATSTPTATPSLTDGNLREFASPSGVVCDLGAGAVVGSGVGAACHVPHPSYPAFEMTDEGPVDVTCPEALVVALPYGADYAMGCAAREESDATVLAAGSTNTYGGHICTVEDDVIECMMDDGSGNGFRVGNSEFEGIRPPTRSAVTQVAATVEVGEWSAAVAVDPNAGEAYAGGDHAIWVIDTTTHQLMYTIYIGRWANAITVDESTGTIYAATANWNAVTVIDAKTREVTGTVDVCQGPGTIDWDSTTGTVWVACSGGRFSIIDTATREVSRLDVPQTDSITDLAIDDTRGFAYGLAFNGLLVKLDTVTHEVKATVNTGEIPSSVAVDPASGTVYVTQGEALHAFTSETLERVGKFPIGFGAARRGLAVDPAAGVLYVSGMNKVTALDTNTLNPIGVIPLGTGEMTGALAINDTTGDLYATNYTTPGGRVWILED